MKIGKTYKYVGPGVEKTAGFGKGSIYDFIGEKVASTFKGDGSGGPGYYYFEECEKEEKEMSAHEKYKKMSELSGFKVGDKVKIWREFSRDEMGCPAEFASRMKELVGKEGVITNTSFWGTFQIDSNWWWPFFVLEKHVEPPVKVKLKSEYTAVVAGDRETVKVGCQTFSREAVLELAEKLKK